MKKDTVKKHVRFINESVVAAGSGMITGLVMNKLIPAKAKASMRLVCAIAASTTVICAQAHIGVYKFVDDASDLMVDGVDNLAKRFGYVREEY